MTDTTLIQRLRTAWTYCGVEQALRFEAAAALEQQAAQIEALQLTKAGLIDSLREEMDEGLRLRELGGALPNENITAMTERLIGERAALAAELSELRADAERYRWLRIQDWFDGPMAVVVNPKDAIKLGHDAPSRERLDAAIDVHLAEVQGFIDSCVDAALRQEQGGTR